MKNKKINEETKGGSDVNLKLLYLNNLSKPIIKYQQIKNMNLEKQNIGGIVHKNEDKSNKTVFTDDDFKEFAKSYFNK